MKAFLARESQQDKDLIFEKLFEVSPFLMGIVKLENDTIVHLVDNQATCDFFQKKPSSTREKRAEEIGAARNYVELWQENYIKCMNNKIPVCFEYDHDIFGEVRTLRATVSPLGRSERGIPLFFYIAEDISAAKNISAKLSLEKEKFETIVNHIPFMLGLFSDNNDLEWCNREWKEKLGGNINSHKGLDLWSQLYPIRAERDRAIQFLESKNEAWQELTTKNRQGNFFPSIWANVELSSGDFIRIGKDIEAEKKQERIIAEQRALMVHSARLSTLGEMAGGVAHEINNPLSIILGKTSQLKSKIASGHVDESTILDSLALIEKTADRIGKIVKGLRLFSRSGEGEPYLACKFGTILQDTLDLCLERMRQKEVELKLKIEEGIILECRSVQISQILLNLIGNSIDAIQNTSKPWIEIEAKQDKGQAFITVTDSGNGILEDHIEKIMIPFFTTKELGKGTGLGLSISKSIAQDHGGSLEYISNSKHTRFLLILPLKQSPANGA